MFSLAKLLVDFCLIKIYNWIISCYIDPIWTNKLYSDDMNKGSVISSISTLNFKYLRE